MGMSIMILLVILAGLVVIGAIAAIIIVIVNKSQKSTTANQPMGNATSYMPTEGYCPSCGSPYAQGATFCQGCGTKLGE